MYSRRGNILCQCKPGFPHGMLSALPLPQPQEHHIPPGLILENDTHLWTLIIWAPMFAKMCNIKFLPIPKLNYLGGVLWLSESNAVLSLPLCLSPLCKKSSIPSLTLRLFSPPIYVSAQNACHVSHSNYVHCFLNSQIYFLDVQNDL